jgi:hypothetical protein
MYDDLDLGTQQILANIASWDPEKASRAAADIRASRVRNWVHANASSDYERALQLARSIPAPWYRCQALSSVAEVTADPDAKRALIAEAFASALETAEPKSDSQYLSVAPRSATRHSYHSRGCARGRAPARYKSGRATFTTEVSGAGRDSVCSPIWTHGLLLESAGCLHCFMHRRRRVAQRSSPERRSHASGSAQSRPGYSNHTAN